MAEQERSIVNYRDGGEGMVQWCNDFVYIPIYPEGEDIAEWYPIANLPTEKNAITGRSYAHIWEEQGKILREALVMENGKFLHNLIVLCWQRGEGKSLLACLIQLWKFFNWPRQQIMLGANSKEQTKFVHYDIMRDIILNSPELYDIVGSKNIQEKEVRIMDGKGNKASILRSISSFSGIVSNITGYTFSEIFDMKNPKFFVQLSGSIRNMPNAIGVIDSTVSDKQHILYQIYSNSIQGKAPRTYFSYRSSKNADPNDYWHPYMDQIQIDSYKSIFPFGEFERYFQNLWSAGQARVFTEEMIEGIGYIGADGGIMNVVDVEKIIIDKTKQVDVMEQMAQKKLPDAVEETQVRIQDLYDRLDPVDNIYKLVAQDSIGGNEKASMNDLTRLGDLLDTDFSIHAGLDLSDPTARRSAARSIVTVIAKGLIGSRSNPHTFTMTNDGVPKYVYFVLFMSHIVSPSLNTVKELLDECHEEYDGVDTLCSERWGMWDFQEWCDDREIKFEAVFPTYDRQREAFMELYNAIKYGRFKSPQILIEGSKTRDILREELGLFDHDTDKRWFGSPEKGEKYGIQDDAVYSVGWSIYGGRLFGVNDFRIRKGTHNFGMLIQNRDLLGGYK